MQNCEMDISMVAPRESLYLVLPSMQAQPETLAFSGIFSVIVMVSGTTRGLKDSACGHIGVIRIEGKQWWVIGPPADKE